MSEFDHRMLDRRRAGREPARRSALLLAVAGLALAGCDGLFDVENPTNLLESELEDPRLLDALGNSAEGALSEEYDFAVITGELPADAVINASTNQAELRIDRGVFDGFNEDYESLFNGLSAARWTATEATRRLLELVPDASADMRVARSYYWDAVARITLADLFEEVPFDGGQPNTPLQVYEGAAELLLNAIPIAQAAEDARYVAAAYATLARVYRTVYFESDGDMSAFEQAREYAQNALAANPEFSVALRFEPPGSENQLFASLSEVRQITMDPGYAYTQDPASDQLDPRIQHSGFQRVGAQGDTIYNQLKYPDRAADIAVSRWQEAELILAEYYLLQGDVGQAVAHINAVRTAAGLPTFASSDPAEIRAQLIYERKAEFWLELRRWQDMRYYNIIPERWFPASKEAGVNRRFPVSLRERFGNENY